MGRKKNQPSSIDLLPEPIREEIARLRRANKTIDAIVAHLKGMDVEVSRSAMGRHVKSLDEIGREMRETQEWARFIVEQAGEQTDERLARANMAMLQGTLLRLQAVRPIDEATGEPLQLDLAEAKNLALAIQRVVSAQRMDADRQIRLEREFAKKASEKLDAAAATGEVDPEAVAKAKRIMGFDA